MKKKEFIYERRYGKEEYGIRLEDFPHIKAFPGQKALEILGNIGFNLDSRDFPLIGPAQKGKVPWELPIWEIFPRPWFFQGIGTKKTGGLWPGPKDWKRPPRIGSPPLELKGPNLRLKRPRGVGKKGAGNSQLVSIKVPAKGGRLLEGC